MHSAYRMPALAGLLSLCFTLGCGGGKSPDVEVVRPVKTILVGEGEDVRQRSFPGTVEASRRVELAFRVPGLLAELPVKEGDKVVAGDVIARLRQDEFEARLKTLTGELDQARAALRALQAGERPEEIRRREAEVRAASLRLANGRAEYERGVALAQRSGISQQELERLRTVYNVAQEEYAAARESLEKGAMGREEDIEAMQAQVRGLEGRVVEAQIQLSDSTLLAPYDGVIAQRFVDKAQNIAAGDRVVQFQDAEEIDIAVDVPENIMVADIQRAEILQLTATLSAAPGISFPVRLREIAQVADPVTQTFNVRVAMEAPEDLRVLPGMTASVTAVYRRARVLQPQVMVPVEAIAQTSSGEQLAWVLGEESKVTPRTVKLGAAVGGRIEVLEGLGPGDRIVVAGVRFLRDGMQVRDLGDALGERQ
ncbi:efflux RND transporter periplasmic adaptor subunit [Blastopirellula sp. JC732]|uniref:Efflux RND transporter periplasmic adaptor subunit n=1 Tax=Blastopirellula sediminis TaxID=2894196 RepID=A0A9X1MKM8_9BACT|nr:efflux RND transporter periplasmic adaptor subunit [Blastopirellula sediminis]MCC9608642.1 efflux RND transporter periplasmic adaptor subunit [Blastopirellula sediminis]MCC9628581.1 efflux RND transporter periplasmic adaptor subunit [Blastopirellula sediminis]